MEQAINTFELGLLMDLNPMQQSNKSLSGALNATLLTMNGNELVLLNDMGNARTKSGYLPKGYVPVGVKEYGGVIYIAAYNPITNLSLIGSFPSPLRINGDWNLDEEGLSFNGISDFCDTGTQRNIIKNIIIQLVGDNSILRTGDKFTLYGEFNDNDYNILQDLSYVDGRLKWISLRVGVLSNTNEFVDITDNLVKFGVTDNYELTDNLSPYVLAEDINSGIDISDYYIKVGENYYSCKFAQPDITYYELIDNIYSPVENIEVGKTDISGYYILSDNQYFEATLALTNTDYYYYSNYSYFLAKYPDESNNNELTNKNIDELRKMKEVNTFSLKLSGPLCIKEILNIPENVNHNIDIEREDDTMGYNPVNVEIGSDVSNYYTRTNNSEPYEYEPATGQALENTYYEYVKKYNYTIKPTVYFSGESFPYHDEGFNNIKFKFKIGNLEKEISEFTYSLSEGVLEVTSDDISYETFKINTIDYTITPYFENTEENNKKYINYIKQLEITGSIDLSKVNSGLIELKGFRYFNEDSQTTLSLEIASYPKKDHRFWYLIIEFYKDKTDNLVGIYKTESEGLNGKFTYVIDWENSIIDWNGNSIKLDSRTIYKLKFNYLDNSEEKYIDTGNIDYWLLTTSLFNRCYYPISNNEYIKNYCNRTQDEIDIYNTVTTIPVNADWILISEESDVSSNVYENLLSINEPSTYFGWKETKTYTSNIRGRLKLNLNNPLFPKNLTFTYKENGIKKDISQAGFTYSTEPQTELVDYIGELGEFESTSYFDENDINNEVKISNTTTYTTSENEIQINRLAITTGICYYNSEVGVEELKILTPITDHFTSESVGKYTSKDGNEHYLKNFEVPFRFNEQETIPLELYIDVFPRISFSPGTSDHHINIIESSINIEDTKNSTGAGIAKDYGDVRFNSYRAKSRDEIPTDNGELPTSLYMYGLSSVYVDNSGHDDFNNIKIWDFGDGFENIINISSNNYYCTIYKKHKRLLTSLRGNNLTINLIDYINSSEYLNNIETFVVCGFTAYLVNNNIWMKPLVFLKSENGWGLIDHPFKILYGHIGMPLGDIDVRSQISDVYDGENIILLSNFPDAYRPISKDTINGEQVTSLYQFYDEFSLFTCFSRILYGLKHIYAPNPEGETLSNYYIAGNEFIKTNSYKYTFNSTVTAELSGTITVDDNRFRMASNNSVSVQIPINVKLEEYTNESIDLNPKAAIEIGNDNYIFTNSYIMKKSKNNSFKSCDYFKYNPDANGREDLKITANLSDSLTYDINLPIDRSYNNDYVIGTMSLKNIPALNFEKLYK